eukprot:UN01641
MFNLPIITSHQKLVDEPKYLQELQQQINNTPLTTQDPLFTHKQQLTALNVVQKFSQILSALVIGYHTEKGLQRAQFIR